MKVRDILAVLIILCASFYLLPLIILKKFSEEELSKAAFLIMLIFIFISFAVNIMYVYFREKNILIPIITTLLVIPLVKIFNSSVIILIILVFIFSFLGYFLGKLVAK